MCRQGGTLPLFERVERGRKDGSSLMAVEGKVLSWSSGGNLALMILTWLKQEGYVREYKEKIEVLFGPLKINQPEYLCETFTKG